MYRLKEVGILAFSYIVKKLALFGYPPVKKTPCLWKNETRLTTSTLCVDNFGIKSYNNEEKEHLLNALKTKYEISIDPKGENYT